CDPPALCPYREVLGRLKRAISVTQENADRVARVVNDSEIELPIFIQISRGDVDRIMLNVDGGGGLEGAIPIAQQQIDNAQCVGRDHQVKLVVLVKVADGQRPRLAAHRKSGERLEGSIAVA